MNILISNDDGYDAPGILALTQAMEGLGDLTVVAPLENRSAASSCLTVRDDIIVHRKGDNIFAVDGTPADCVHLALTGDFMPTLPDLIVSGINNGANMGDDTVYSGTVAAAIEGHLFNIPAFAFSMVCFPVTHFATGGAVARALVQRFLQHPPPGQPPLYNINIPDIPEAEISGYVHTRLGRRLPAQKAHPKGESGGGMAYHLGHAGGAKDAAAGTDFAAVQNKQVSITPLTVDHTDSALLSATADWLSGGAAP